MPSTLNMACRGVRGAICASANTAEAIRSATHEVLAELLAVNAIAPEDIASVFFSVTHDLNAAYPAAAARELGLVDSALLCMTEIAVPGALERCIRVLVHWNTTKSQAEIQHLYLGEAARLRPERHWPRRSESADAQHER